MKKLIGALALAAIVATSAFAEVTFGAWLANLPTLVGFDGEDVKGAAVANSWGGFRPARFNLNWNSDDGKAGMVIGIASEDGSIGQFDANNFWIKPVDQVQVTVGFMDNFTGLRGDLCYGSWNWLRPNTWYIDDEGLTFSALSDKGIGLQVRPVDGLQIYASLPLNSNTWTETTYLQRMDLAFGQGKVGAAYTIDGIGTIKAQFLGQYEIGNSSKDAVSGLAVNDYYWVSTGKKTTITDDGDREALVKAGLLAKATTAVEEAAAVVGSEYKKFGTIEAAFDLTGVDQLFVTFGAAFTIADSKWFAADAGTTPLVKLALGASYGITESFKVSASFAARILSSELASHDPQFQFGVGLDFAATEALGIVADVRMKLPNNDADPNLSFLVGATYAVGSNAQLGIGFQGEVGLGSSASKSYLKVVQATEADKFIFAVPIRASIWF